MSASSNQSQSGGMGCLTVMFLIFLTLKLCGVITWSWWWVCSPLLFSAGLISLILFGILVVSLYHFCTRKPRH